MITKLRQLVERYISGAIGFPEFRRAFVMDFLAFTGGDPDVWSTVLQIESECDDFAQGLVTEGNLRLNIAAKFVPLVWYVAPVIISGTSTVYVEMAPAQIDGSAPLPIA